MQLAYLASPYTSPSLLTERVRWNEACQVTARLVAKRYFVYSPIVHGYGIAPHLPQDLASSHDWWMNQCYEMYERCDLLIVLQLDGWKASKGVQQEISWARADGKTVMYATFFMGEIVLSDTENVDQ